MYGCGENAACTKLFKDNKVTIPDAAFSIEDDPTRYVDWKI